MPDDRALASLAVLTDAQRRRVFDHVQGHPECTVTELAGALDVGRTLVSFHLGKLVDAGLVELVAAERRRGVRGRPSQRYRVSRREVSATVPDRRYDLLAEVLLAGLAEHRDGESASASAARAARRRGAQLAGTQRPAPGRLEDLVAALGYAPAAGDGDGERDGAGPLVLRNCPFDRMRAQCTEQVCGLNLALAEGYLDGLGLAGRVHARLSPDPARCCVVFDGTSANRG